jgi:hypothetical protein
MWQSKNVEKALFRWKRWRQSIICQWVSLTDELEESHVTQLKLQARQELANLGFPTSILFELYWVCCTASDYNFQDETSFERIRVPAWLPFPFDEAIQFHKIEPGMRIFPPNILDELDIRFIAQKWGLPTFNIYANEHRIFLTSSHELHDILQQLRGRPRRPVRPPDRPRRYSDRLAVRCATLRDELGKSYEQIPDSLRLPDEVYERGQQVDVVKRLVIRGRELIDAHKTL